MIAPLAQAIWQDGINQEARLTDWLFICLLFGYTNQTDTTEAKDMATKKKQVEETAPANDELQQILDHFGENSAEYRFALMQIKPTKAIYKPEDVSKEQIDNLISSEAMRGE